MIAILLSGRAGVGKSTTAGFMKEVLFPDANIFPFARAVKDTARYMGWDGQKDSKGRQLLISVGAAGREYNQNTWAAKTLEYIFQEMPKVAIIDDWRYPNEGLYLSEHGLKTVLVRIHSPEREMLKGTGFYNDSSESSLPGFLENLNFYDYYIVNDGSLEDLRAKANLIAEQIIKRSEL